MMKIWCDGKIELYFIHARTRNPSENDPGTHGRGTGRGGGGGIKMTRWWIRRSPYRYFPLGPSRPSVFLARYINRETEHFRSDGFRLTARHNPDWLRVPAIVISRTATDARRVAGSFRACAAGRIDMTANVENENENIFSVIIESYLVWVSVGITISRSEHLSQQNNNVRGSNAFWFHIVRGAEKFRFQILPAEYLVFSHKRTSDGVFHKRGVCSQ